jgi:exodeoxyribonuclease VII large subunit
MWRTSFSSAKVELKQGMLVEVSGVFTVYAAKGRMNFDVKALRVAGEGDLRLKVAKLAKKLEAEGLMAASKKRVLPAFPSAVAIVTSPRGKAIHDVLRTLRRRFPLVEVLICGVPVEGAGAAASIIEGLKAAQNSKAEAILLVRGGGSYEDLMPFNDEQLARAIASSKLPVITGIGHEPDNSIADMVADVRASTPTAAAERIVPNADELKAALDHVQDGLVRLLNIKLEQAKSRYARLSERPIFTDKTQLFANFELQIDGVAERLYQALPQKLAGERSWVENVTSKLSGLGHRLLTPYVGTIGVNAAKLESLSPLKVLSRGYSIVFDANDHVLDSIDKIDLEQQINVRFSDGIINAKVVAKQHATLSDKNREGQHG